MVFFELKDKSAESKKKLVDACYKYLKNHDGVLYFSAGPRAEDVKEPVSATDWDVALHIVFKNKPPSKSTARTPTTRSSSTRTRRTGRASRCTTRTSTRSEMTNDQ